MEARIDSTLMDAHKGQVVRVMGKCESFDQGSRTGTIVATGPINLSLPDAEDMVVGQNYELTGKVSADGKKITGYKVLELSDNLNLDAAQKMARFTHKVPELYSDAS